MHKENVQKLSTPLADYQLTKNRVLYTQAKGVEFTDENMEENYQQLKEFLGGEKVFILSDTTNTQPYDKKHRLAFEKQAEEFAIAVALTAKSSLGIAVANIFIMMLQKPIPVKMFKTEEKALRWLNEQRPHSFKKFKDSFNKD